MQFIPALKMVTKTDNLILVIQFEGATMSLVEHIDHEIRNARFQEPAYTTYSVIHEDGETRVQLQSYGSADRVKQGDASQVVQFNKESAKELIKILYKEFGFSLELV